MSIRHPFVSPAAAHPNPDLVDGPKFNQEHVLDGGLVDQVVTRDPAFDPPSGPGFKLAYPKLRETGGPTTLTPGAIPDGGVLWRQGTSLVGVSLGGEQQVLGIVSGAPAYVDRPRVLNRQTATVEVVNTDAETDLYNFTVPGGTLGTDKALRLLVLGDWLNNTGAGRVPALVVRFGASVIHSTLLLPSVAASAQRRRFVLVVNLAGKGATGAQVSGAEFRLSDPTVGDTGLFAAATDVLGVNPAVAVDSTQDQILRVAADHDIADANLSARCFLARLELVP